MKRRRVLSIVAFASALLATTPIVPSDAADGGDSLRLEVVRRLVLPGGSTPAMDLRWHERDRMLILRARDGVTEYRLVDGLPSLRRLLPGRNQQPRISPQIFLSESNDRVMSATVNAQFVWTKIEAGSSAKVGVAQFPVAGIGDCELSGDEVYVLGLPSSEKREHLGKVLVWKARLEETLSDFEAVADDPDPADAEELGRRQYYLVAFAGSMAISEKGDLLVWPGYSTEAYRFSSAGKLKDRWDLSELGTSSTELDGEVRRGALTIDAVRRGVNSHGAAIDDVFFVGEEPMAVLRHSVEGSRQWAILRLDDPELRLHRLPIGDGGTDARLRAAVRPDGEEIALLVADRGGPRSAETSEDQKLLIVRFVDRADDGAR